VLRLGAFGTPAATNPSLVAKRYDVWPECAESRLEVRLSIPDVVRQGR
jgi:hypothetical protein